MKELYCFSSCKKHVWLHLSSAELFFITKLGLNYVKFQTELHYISEFQNMLIGQSIEMMGLTDKVYNDKQCAYQATEFNIVDLLSCTNADFITFFFC